MHRRFLVYALVIVVAVGGALVVLTRESPHPGGGGGGFAPRAPRAPDVPDTPWEPSPEHDAAANAGFTVEAERRNAPLAGNRSGDWACFNGPRRDNCSSDTGLLSEWPADGPALAWAARGLGAGYSSVAVVEGVVYTMGNKDTVEAIVALDAGTGEKVWSTPIAWASRLSLGDGPRSTPAVSGGAVYALGGNGDLACLDAATGKVRWQKSLTKDYAGSLPGWGFCESVLIDQGRLICTPGGDEATLVALDAGTGAEVWKSAVPGNDRAGYASPIVVDAAGVRQYVQFTAGGTIGLRAEDGTFLWRETSASNPSANCSSPLAAGDVVFSASNYGTGGALVRLSASGSKVEATLVYQTRDMKCHHGDMVIAGGFLFGSDDPGVLTCLELQTGKRKWQNRSVGKGAVTWADGMIYLRGEQGGVALVEATGAGYRERGRFDQPERSSASAWAHPVVAAGRLFLRDQDVLLCYDLRAGR